MSAGTRTALCALALCLATSTPVFAQTLPTDVEMREVHAVLLGLAQDGAQPERTGSADVYYSIVDNPAAPRLVTRLEVAGAPCRVRTISALQFPDKWATLVLGVADLSRITSAVAYASIDDMIAGTNPVPLDSDKAEQVVLTGKGLYCTSRMSLADEDDMQEGNCPDRLDLTMTDDTDKKRGRNALAIVADFCRPPALAGK